MKFVTLCLVLAVAVFGAVGLAAQDRPNFSGTWVVVGPDQGIRELTIKHDDSALSLEGQPDDTPGLRGNHGFHLPPGRDLFHRRVPC